MFRSEKPITAVSQLIERITKEEYDEEDLSDLPQLIEAIRLQRSTGPTEAARAIRKKLKYGNPHRQLRALTILDDLIRNAGVGFQRSFADEMLLERLRIIATDPLTDTDVKNKCQKLYRQWAALYKGTEGLGGIANLYRQLPQRKRPVNKENSKVLRETEQFDADDEEGPGPGHGRKTSVSAAAASTSGTRRSSGAPATLSGFHAAQASSSKTSSGSTAGIFSSSSKSKDKKKAKIFNLEKEKPQMQNVITEASIESTNLMNALMHINREKERISENAEVRKRFEVCKQLRRQTFRYCTLVTDEKYLGTLLHANDQLSDVLVLYEQLDRSFDYDSDSEDYEGGGTSTGAGFYLSKGPASPAMTQSQMAALSLDDGPPVRPPRPTAAVIAPDGGKGKAKYYNDPSEEAEDDDDDDNPFADRNAVNTPGSEKRSLDWGSR